VFKCFSVVDVVDVVGDVVVVVGELAVELDVSEPSLEAELVDIFVIFTSWTRFTGDIFKIRLRLPQYSTKRFLGGKEVL
jgi:hypothetical protein